MIIFFYLLNVIKIDLAKKKKKVGTHLVEACSARNHDSRLFSILHLLGI